MPFTCELFLPCTTKLRGIRIQGIHSTELTRSGVVRRFGFGEMTYEEAHLLSLVSTLGQRHAQSGYVKDPDCEGALCFKFQIIVIDSLSMTPASLHDIIRFLQKDTSLERSVFLQLATWNVLGKDLLPLFSVHHAQPDICTLLGALIVQSIEKNSHFAQSNFWSSSLCHQRGKVTTLFVRRAQLVLSYGCVWTTKTF